MRDRGHLERSGRLERGARSRTSSSNAACWLPAMLAVAGCDEVGRGSLGGPVSVGMVVVECLHPAAAGRPPRQQALAPPARESLVPRIESWSCCWAIGHATAAEIDAIGILRALRLAGERALAALSVRPDLVLLDGNYDWFTRPERSAGLAGSLEPDQVTLKVKADLTCASVAAASVIAKVARRPAHGRARQLVSRSTAGSRTRATPPRSTGRHCCEVGPCEEHRRSWHLLVSDEPTLFGTTSSSSEDEDPA